MDTPVARPLSWRKRKAKIRYNRRWTKPFVAVEWGLEWAVYEMKNWALLEFLQLITAFSVLIGLVTFLHGRKDQIAHQRKATHYQAWQVINSAYDQPGSGGRIDALQDLASDGVSLETVDLSHAWLQELALPGANLRRAALDSTDLWGGYLVGVDFSDATMIHVRLARANLCGATLERATLTGRPDLSHGEFRNAHLSEVNLDRVRGVAMDFSGADLAAAYLANSYLNGFFGGADLSYADLRGADLTDSEGLREAIMSGANVYGAQFRDAGTRKWALSAGGAISEPDSVKWSRRRFDFLQNRSRSAAREDGRCPGRAESDVERWQNHLREIRPAAAPLTQW
jgi:uncharacterized protein YjbI with pentapeptide repeats